MIEKLCTPSDDDHNEHKKLQLRELAALNGTLKEVNECYLCGMEGHTPEMCPNKVQPAGRGGSSWREEQPQQLSCCTFALRTE